MSFPLHTLIPTSSRPYHHLNLDPHNNMQFNAPISYASKLATKGFKPSASTSTLFQAIHSSSGAETKGSVSPSPRRSTMPQSLSAFSSQQAPTDRSSATQQFPISGDSKGSQPVPVRCIANSNWSACVHQTRGDDRSGLRKSFAPVSDSGQLSALPRQQTAHTATSATDHSLKRPDLLPSERPLSAGKSERTLTPKEYDEWTLEQIRQGRNTEMP